MRNDVDLRAVNLIWENDDGEKTTVNFGIGDEQDPDLILKKITSPPTAVIQAPRELWDLEMELSNVACYAMGPVLNSQEALAKRFQEIRDKVRNMIREYGYKGHF